MTDEFPIKCPIDGRECRSTYTCNVCPVLRKVGAGNRKNAGIFASCLRMGVEIEALQRRRAVVIASGSIKEDYIMKDKEKKMSWAQKALEWLKSNPSTDGKGHRLKDIGEVLKLPPGRSPYAVLYRAVERGDIIKIQRGRFEHKDHVKRELCGYTNDIRERIHKILKALEGLSPHQATTALKVAEQHVFFHSQIAMPVNILSLLEESQVKSEEFAKKISSTTEPGMMHT